MLWHPGVWRDVSSACSHVRIYLHPFTDSSTSELGCSDSMRNPLRIFTVAQGDSSRTFTYQMQNTVQNEVRHVSKYLYYAFLVIFMRSA